MKKYLILFLLVFGVIPCLKSGQLTFTGLSEVYADDFGGEYDTPDITLDGVDTSDPHLLKEVVITAYQDYYDPNWFANMFYLMNYLQNITLPDVVSSDGFDWDAFLAELEDMFSSQQAPPSPPDPCTQASKAKTKADNATLDNQSANVALDSYLTHKEYGAEQNLSSFPPGSSANYKDIAPRTDGVFNTFMPKFTWDSTNGYTVGFTHGHWTGDAPSPADVVISADYLKNPDLIAGGQAAIDYFKANMTVTSSSASNGTYAVSISDWGKLQAYSDAYYANPSAEAATDLRFQNYGSDYLSNHPGASVGEAGAYALLKMYGDAITVLHAPASTHDFKPQKLNGSGKVVDTSCP